MTTTDPVKTEVLSNTIKPLTPEILEEYKIIMQDAANVNTRRQITNDVYVGINILFISAAGFLVTSAQVNLMWVTGVIWALCVIMTGFNINWYSTIRDYKNALNIFYQCILGLENNYDFKARLEKNLQINLSKRKFNGDVKSYDSLWELRLVRYFIVLYPLVAIAITSVTFLVLNHVIAAPLK